MVAQCVGTTPLPHDPCMGGSAVHYALHAPGGKPAPTAAATLA